MPLSENAIRMLRYLVEQDGAPNPQKRVARAIGLGSAGALTEKLRESGLITKTYSFEARDFRLSITDEGRQILAAEGRE